MSIPRTQKVSQEFPVALKVGESSLNSPNSLSFFMIVSGEPIYVHNQHTVVHIEA